MNLALLSLMASAMLLSGDQGFARLFIARRHMDEMSAS